MFPRLPASRLPFSITHLAAIGIASALMLATADAAETPPVKPGLWEITTEGQTLDGKSMADVSTQMAEQLKKMPPEMRQQMEAHMKAKGVQMVPGSGQTAVRLCLTEAMLQPDNWQKAQGQCQNTAMTRSGATWRWKFTCSQPPSEGEGQTTFQGAQAYVTEMRVHTQRQGKASEMTMKHRGRWLGADCGDIKPLTPPPAAK